jgi:hypothetical protein
VRFLDMLGAYDAQLRQAAHAAAQAGGFVLREGVYTMVAGPNFETLAEIRFLQRMGADAVGMSTIPEVIVARHEGMRVLGLSAITDMAVGPSATSEIAHEAVLAAANQIRPRLAAVVRGVLASIAQSDSPTAGHSPPGANPAERDSRFAENAAEGDSPSGKNPAQSNSPSGANPAQSNSPSGANPAEGDSPLGRNPS